ncbi:cobalt-precorrin-5B (C(1))-methyltransferase CbiD [Argonema galeatum]|uniref:cobalt-precorrin-5B (C(1))-methyltransferase CbiD n=1 Tax=Argonema galeatum TaxID=2942762 RepID=UPI0020122F76|nr:cobalt-precorrin-5B (C(1))-methyltransferase CbiD [Argonema galeatum]MCL1467453.1 cobalt-precorrin-5B (C(1))-methyltransferase CbiD [Argonema galeatum A003/A1]
MARTGYTLPVFAVAAAKAALLHLQTRNLETLQSVAIDLMPGEATIPIEQVAQLEVDSALAIAISDPGDNLDLTRNTPIWAWVKLQQRNSEPLILEGGEGVGKTASGESAIYSYARRLFEANLLPLIPPDRTVTVSIIIPEGRQLAQRTSNEAFGILEGLSLLGTSGISQPLSAEEHLEEFRQILQAKVQHQSDLVFCIGSNGMQVAQRLSIPETAIVQTGNWIGALLVEAALRGAESVLLLGYQGKLIKLAGGIFNTSSHLADAKLEIISAAVVRAGSSLQNVEAVLAAKTADAAYKILVELELAELVFQALANTISQKAQAFVQKYANVPLKVGTVLFDRQGKIIARDAIAVQLIEGLKLVKKINSTTN